MSYSRNLSPGGRRVNNPARASDSSFDPYYAQRHNSYASPRASTDRVIPISTQTYVNLPSTNTGSSNRPVSGYDAYSGRPRRSSLVDNSRGVSSSNQIPTRSRPTVVQGDIPPPSPPRRDRDYYVTPAVSEKPKESRKFEHKKVYSVDDGGAKLVADVDMSGGGGDRHHRRKESGSGYRNLGIGHDRGRKAYHANGKREKAIGDEDFSYTDPASMYKDTEPRWRETRQRRGSVDRGGASRERPVSMLEPFGGDPRRSTRDIGPPPSQRGWGKINDIGRSNTVREKVAHSPSRQRDDSRGRYIDSRDPYYVPPRRESVDRNRSSAVHQDRPTERHEPYEFEERRERHHERRYSGSRPNDRSVSRRGFGLRSDSQDRFGPRGSDESFEARKRDLARDSGYVEPHRRDTIPNANYPDPSGRRMQPEDRERDVPHKESRRRDYDRSFEDYESDRDRASGRHKHRDRDQDRNQGSDREDRREKHHHRRDTADREYDRRDKDQKDSGDNAGGAAKIAAGGLGAAAALFGINREKEKKEEREREKERERERERQREPDRVREAERAREQEPRFDDRKDRDTDSSDRRRRGPGSHSDEAPFERPRDTYADADRGLGFAFEAPEGQRARDAPREAPRDNREATRDIPGTFPSQEAQYPPQPPRPQDRDFGQASFDSQPPSQPTAPMPPSAIDPDEDYRRRMEQAQREFGLPPEQHHSSDSDPDRERRRRGREQRHAGRQERMTNGLSDPASSFSDAGPHTQQPNGLRRSFEDDASQAPSSATWASVAPSTVFGAQQRDLRRRNSILDRPMNPDNQDSVAPMAQIIDNSQSDKRETRVRIVDPPTEDDDKRPKGILKRPTQKFPEDPNSVREGVAPLKDANKKGIPPGARWTKIDRRLVNPEALEDAKERFEERLDFVIVLRVLTKEEIQKLADRTREIREKRNDEERAERKSSRRRDRERDRKDRDEYLDDNSEDEYAPRKPRMLEAPASTVSGAPSSDADFVRENRERRSERDRDREAQYMSGGRGSRE